MFGYQFRRDAFGLVCLMAVAALTGSHTSAQAQPTCTGFAVGCAVHWQMPPPKGASTWRAGSYTGTIVEVDGGGKKGVPNEVRLDDIKSGLPFSAGMDQLNSIRCYPPEWTHIPSVTYEVMVCHLGGAVSGPAVFSFSPWLKVQLSQEIVLSDGRTTNMFAGHVESFGSVALGLGVNQWAKGGVTPQPQPPQPPVPQPPVPQPPIPQPGVVKEVPEIGQGYAQALKIGYPAVLHAHMGAQDYDTVLFNFAGGPFHAHTNSQLNLVADLLDAQGNMITRAVGGNLQFNQNLPAGTYGIIVRVMNYAGTGPYELVLGSGMGTTYLERE